MGGAVSASTNNDDMVTKLINATYIKTVAVEMAFRAVDRGHYVSQKDAAYNDTAWKSDHLHISAPCIYAQVCSRITCIYLFRRYLYQFRASFEIYLQILLQN